jgi:hypothetical protein
MAFHLKSSIAKMFHLEAKTSPARMDTGEKEALKHAPKNQAKVNAKNKADSKAAWANAHPKTKPLPRAHYDKGL